MKDRVIIFATASTGLMGAVVGASPFGAMPTLMKSNRTIAIVLKF